MFEPLKFYCSYLSIETKLQHNVIFYNNATMIKHTMDAAKVLLDHPLYHKNNENFTGIHKTSLAIKIIRKESYTDCYRGNALDL